MMQEVDMREEMNVRGQWLRWRRLGEEAGLYERGSGHEGEDGYEKEAEMREEVVMRVKLGEE
jgi:hypothetical protein